jgi:16S rRNA (uracil1498-N3)-methyltransferase
VSDPFFFVDVLPAAGGFTLDGPEGRHASAVRRMQLGERLVLTDGAGGQAGAVVTGVGREALELEVSDVARNPPPTPQLTVVQALPKGDRGELAVQMLTEAGVDEVVPWQAARCVTKWQWERGRKSWQRWQTTAREAAKQSRRTWLPRIAEVASTAGVAAGLQGRTVLVLHEEATEPLSTVELPVGADVALVVGPEGGIAESELEIFQAVGGRAVRLGPTVLRTSTAGVAALAVVNTRVGRWA